MSNRILIVTGLSGAGRTSALKILEENNWQQLIEKAINGAFVRANELSEE